MKKLTKDEMKKVMGGDIDYEEDGNGEYCDGCKKFCWTIPGDSWGNGKCKAGSPPSCKNYCFEGGAVRWCD